VRQPLLVVVSGYDPSATELAQAIARAIPCPAICRDEIKEGLVYGLEDYTPERGDEMNREAAETFFGVVDFLVGAGVSAVAQASFQHPLWEHGLGPTLDRARVRVVQTHGDPEVAWERMARRAALNPARLAVHGDPSLREPYESFRQKWESFQALSLPVPSIRVDTTDGYEPGLDEIVAFLKRS
jgi:predicted kinase